MDFSVIYNLILTTAIGIITFFLKRSFDKLDSCASNVDIERLEKKIDLVNNKCASESELEELKEKVERADEKYASKAELNDLKKQIDKIETNIDFLKENAVRNAEFVRMMSRLETMIDSLKKE